jgi:hypothetical protein
VAETMIEAQDPTHERPALGANTTWIADFFQS